MGLTEGHRLLDRLRGEGGKDVCMRDRRKELWRCCMFCIEEFWLSAYQSRYLTDCEQIE